jgi:predicted RNA binding protein YcfA (HicA-like mRNA interferase family)
MYMNGKFVIKKLEQEGWKVLRSHGSYYRLGKGQLRMTVPVHGNKYLGKGLISAIERQTGVKLT